MEVLAGVFHLVGMMNPAAALDTAGSKFLGVWRRQHKRRRELEAASMDRLVDTRTAGYDEAASIAKSLTAVARADTPLVLVVDDAQWADPALVSLLRHLVQLEEAPVLVVSTVWPDKLLEQGGSGPETFGAWLRGTEIRHPDRLRRISLSSLADDDLGRIVVEVAPRTAEATVAEIAALASGNPLVLNLLLDLDLLRQDVRGDGRIDTDPEQLQRLPAELRAIYQDLWRQLPEPVRRVLALVAVQGPEFLPGFVETAAIALGMYDELMPALTAARDVHGWIRPVNDDRYEFSERQRFEVAVDVLDEVFSDEAQNTVRRVVIHDVLAVKASPRWRDLDLRTRRLALESHIELNEQLGEAADRDLVQLADTMVQLAALELDAGNPTAAVALAERGHRLSIELGVGDEALLNAKSILGDALANANRTDDAVPILAEVIASSTPTDADRVAEVAELISELEEDAPEVSLTSGGPAADEPAIVPGGTEADEWGRVNLRSWEPHPVPALTDLPASEVADLIVEVVAAEGPVLAGRVYDRLRSASGASRQGRLIRAALNSGARAAMRRGDIVASPADARGDSGRRVLRLPSQPEVKLRRGGDRDAWAIPPDELVELGRRVMAVEPHLSRDQLKRRLAHLVGFMHYTKALDDLLEGVLPSSMVTAEGTSNEVTDSPTSGGPAANEASGGPQWAAAYAALAALRPGEWTSVADLAAIVGTSSGWMARHLYTRQDRAGLHRMLNRDGSPWRHLSDSTGNPAEADAMRRRLEEEGVVFDPNGRASARQHITAQLLQERLRGNESEVGGEVSADAGTAGLPATKASGWEAVYRAIESLSPGEWTSFTELATIAGTTPAWVARHMYKEQHRAGIWRLLNRDGTVWRYLERPGGFRWDAAEVREQLKAEGLLFDEEGYASQEQCVKAEVLRRRLQRPS